MGHEFEEISSRVIEAAIAVHKELGPGFLESIYESALGVALTHRELPHRRQVEIRIAFEGVPIGDHRLDMIVADELVVELKAVKALEEIHFAQVRSYLKASKLHVGLLMNFNAPTLIIKRIVV